MGMRVAQDCDLGTDPHPWRRLSGLRLVSCCCCPSTASASSPSPTAPMPARRRRSGTRRSSCTGPACCAARALPVSDGARRGLSRRRRHVRGRQPRAGPRPAGDELPDGPLAENWARELARLKARGRRVPRPTRRSPPTGALAGRFSWTCERGRLAGPSAARPDQPADHPGAAADVRRSAAAMSWAATVLTLYPEMFPGPLGHSLAGRALGEGIWSLDTVQIRDFATDKPSLGRRHAGRRRGGDGDARRRARRARSTMCWSAVRTRRCWR